MDKTLQDHVWPILPKEFKEEVKKYYQTLHEQHKEYDRLHFDNARAKVQERIVTLEYFFGIHNLTSDAEGEDELLTIPRSVIQEIYSRAKRDRDKENVSSSDKDRYDSNIKLLKGLFGSKCLPDVDSSEPNVDSLDGNVESLKPKPAEPKFKVGDYVRYKGDVHKVVATTKDDRCYLNKILGSIDESDLEPYTEPEASACTDDCPSQYKSQNFDNILKNSFSKERRLNIAAMIMASMMQNAKWGDKYSHIASMSCAAADALIAESDKGGVDGED